MAKHYTRSRIGFLCRSQSEDFTNDHPKQLGRQICVGTVSRSDTYNGNNRWNKAKEDISVISSRTGIPFSKVSSYYHRNSAVLSSTLLSLVTVNSDKYTRGTDTFKDVERIFSYATQYGVSPDITSAIYQITFPDSSAAVDLVKLLLREPDGQNINSSTQSLHSSNMLKKSHSMDRLSMLSSRPSLGESDKRTEHEYMPSHTSQPFRSAIYTPETKVKSNTNIVGSSKHPSPEIINDERSRSYNAYIKHSDCTGEHDRTVDLHGYNVVEAKEIVRKEVKAWWTGLGEAKAGTMNVDGSWSIKFRNPRQQPRLLFITGKGKHSEGGRGKIGPAISKFLRNDRWKLEIGDGSLAVYGRY